MSRLMGFDINVIARLNGRQNGEKRSWAAGRLGAGIRGNLTERADGRCDLMVPLCGPGGKEQ
jgi:hypothetical protein